MTDQQHTGGRRPSLVLVTGAGRSGTSTVTGTLHHLGYHVPQPVLNTNKSNPRGFFESTWPLWFHRRIMDAAVIEQIDGRPEAADLMTNAVTPEVRAELAEWLQGELAGHDRVVVKDPRSAWVPQLWEDTGRALGAEVRYLTMLRHPAEILASRSTYYTKPRDEMGDWAFAVMNLCGWVNINLVVERHTRELPRIWVRYDDLLTDWRASMSAVRDVLGLPIDDTLDAAPGTHPVDEFIAPDLRRHEPDWESRGMPDELREVAETVWTAGSLLADAHGRSNEAEEMFDEARARYDRLYRDSVAIARDDTVAQLKAAETKVRRQARRGAAKRAAEAEAARLAAMSRPRRLVARAARRWA
jgi:hypothetical protein